MRQRRAIGPWLPHVRWLEARHGLGRVAPFYRKVLRSGLGLGLGLELELGLRTYLHSVHCTRTRFPSLSAFSGVMTQSMVGDRMHGSAPGPFPTLAALDAKEVVFQRGWLSLRLVVTAAGCQGGWLPRGLPANAHRGAGGGRAPCLKPRVAPCSRACNVITRACQCVLQVDL
jgi:hypothetical protein